MELIKAVIIETPELLILALIAPALLLFQWLVNLLDLVDKIKKKIKEAEK